MITQKKRVACDALYLMSKTANGKFEFLFTPVGSQGKRPNLAALLTDIHK